jgi:LCP family protein required for cell wall assembly
MIAVGLVVVVVATIAVAAWETDRQLEGSKRGLPSNVTRRGVAPKSGDGFTVLVVGVDRNSTGDGLQLIRVESGEPLRVLSIPRDLLLDAQDGGERGATIFHQQGPAALVRAVSRTTDTPIHRVVIIRLTSMRQLVDAVGPITVHNPARLETREIAGKSWTFRKGSIDLDGRAAEAYMRARHNEADVTESDSDRSLRQQLVITALLRSIGPTDVLFHPRATPRQFLHGIATNLTLGEVVATARSARSGSPIRCQLPGDERLAQTTDEDLPWTPRRDGLFLVPDEDDIERVVDGWIAGNRSACHA